MFFFRLMSSKDFLLLRHGSFFTFLLFTLQQLISWIFSTFFHLTFFCLTIITQLWLLLWQKNFHPIQFQNKLGASIFSSAEKIGPANLRNDDDKFTSLERSSPAFSSHPLWHTLENRSPPWLTSTPKWGQNMDSHSTTERQTAALFQSPQTAR